MTSKGNVSSSPLFPIPDVCYEASFWTWARVIVAFTLLLIIVSNVLLLLVTWRAVHTRINPFFFGSLAMSDLLMGALVLPFHLSFAVEKKADRYDDAACTLSGLLFHILQTISLISFFALSLDRLLSIEIPLRYVTILTRKVNVAVLVLMWGLPALLYGLMPATGLGYYTYKCWQCMCNLDIVNLRYLTFLMLFSTCIFLSTYLLNGRIFFVAHRQRLRMLQMQQRFHAQTGKKLDISDKMKAARSILLALSLFTLCWGPYYTALFCFVLFGAQISPVAEFGLLWLAISNSYMNFFIFLTTYRSFRLQFFKMIGLINRVQASEITAISNT